MPSLDTAVPSARSRAYYGMILLLAAGLALVVTTRPHVPAAAASTPPIDVSEPRYAYVQYAASDKDLCHAVPFPLVAALRSLILAQLMTYQRLEELGVNAERALLYDERLDSSDGADTHRFLHEIEHRQGVRLHRAAVIPTGMPDYEPGYINGAHFAPPPVGLALTFPQTSTRRLDSSFKF